METRHFKVIIESEPEGGYSAYVPSLPGCASQGETIDEATTNIKEAIGLYIKSLEEDNIPVPKHDVDIILEDIEVAIA